MMSERRMLGSQCREGFWEHSSERKRKRCCYTCEVRKRFWGHIAKGGDACNISEGCQEHESETGIPGNILSESWSTRASYDLPTWGPYSSLSVQRRMLRGLRQPNGTDNKGTNSLSGCDCLKFVHIQLSSCCLSLD